MKRTLISAAVLAATLAAPAVNAEEMTGEQVQVQPVASADVPDEQVQALERRLAELEAAGAATPAADSGVAGKLKINGFMSAGFGSADVDDFTYDNGLYNQVSHKADSIVGLQVEGEVNDKINAVMQLVARGEDDFAVGAEWAYVGYRPTAVDEFRAGRLRASFYMMSEYLEVGYSYPWARPPAELYQADFPSSYDGLSWLHKFTAGSWQHDLQLNWGSTKSPGDAASQLDAEDAWGVGVTSTHGDWQFGARLSGASLTANNPIFDLLSSPVVLPGPLVLPAEIAPVERQQIEYAAVGMQYDNGSLLVMAEGTQITIDGVIPDTDSAYITIGYRFGKVMPHLTYSGMQITDADDERPDVAWLPMLCPAPGSAGCLVPALGIPFQTDTLSRLLESEQESATLGVRYDFLPNAALKVDWTRVLDTHGTFGLFSHEQSNLLPTAVLPDEEVDIFRVVVDVVF